MENDVTHQNRVSLNVRENGRVEHQEFQYIFEL